MIKISRKLDGSRRGKSRHEAQLQPENEEDEGEGGRQQGGQQGRGVTEVLIALGDEAGNTQRSFIAFAFNICTGVGAFSDHTQLF